MSARSATLSWVNRTRQHLGLSRLSRLRKGVPGSPNNCAIARSVSEPTAGVRAAFRGHLTIGGLTYTLDLSVTHQGPPEVWRRTENLPPLTLDVAHFAQQFDSGQHPDLELSRMPRGP